MKEMNLKDIQEVSLHIMKHIHAFCVQNSIKYSLGYGSLIGAIRHQGFIPWDDDMDIIMPRPDYDRFIKEYQDSSEFRLLTPERGNSHKTYARLCEIKRTAAWVDLPWFEGDCGVWIDIFPIDGVSDNVETRALDGAKLVNLNNKLFIARRSLREISLSLPLKRIITTFYRKLKHSSFELSSLQNEIQKLMRKYNYEESEYCGNLGFVGYNKKECLPKAIFEKYELHPFNDAEFYIISGYDKNLRNYYGDYMQLPPEEKRNPGHSKAQLFYWR